MTTPPNQAPSTGGESERLDPPVCPMFANPEGLPAYVQIVSLFDRHGYPAPAWRLLDELVVALLWARYGEAAERLIEQLQRERDEAITPRPFGAYSVAEAKQDLRKGDASGLIELAELAVYYRERADTWRGIAAAMGYEPKAHSNVRPQQVWLLDRVAKYRALAAEASAQQMREVLEWIAAFAKVRAADDSKTFARVNRAALRTIAATATAALASPLAQASADTAERAFRAGFDAGDEWGDRHARGLRVSAAEPLTEDSAWAAFRAKDAPDV